MILWGGEELGLSDQDIARGVCEHGLLRRSCEICELRKENEILYVEIEGLKHELIEALKRRRNGVFYMTGEAGEDVRRISELKRELNQ